MQDCRQWKLQSCSLTGSRISPRNTERWNPTNKQTQEWEHQVCLEKGGKRQRAYRRTKQVFVGTGCPSNFLRLGAHAWTAIRNNITTKTKYCECAFSKWVTVVDSKTVHSNKKKSAFQLMTSDVMYDVLKLLPPLIRLLLNLETVIHSLISCMLPYHITENMYIRTYRNSWILVAETWYGKEKKNGLTYNTSSQQKPVKYFKLALNALMAA